MPVPRSSSERIGAVGERGADRVLDRRVGDMQLADAVPLRGMATEIGLRCGGALRPHGREPLAIAGERCVVRDRGGR